MPKHHELRNMSKTRILDSLHNSEILPIITDSRDITFGAMHYVEEVVGALLQAKRADGPAWKSASKLVDITYSIDGHVHLELKVHGIDVGSSGGSAISKPAMIKFEY